MQMGETISIANKAIKEGKCSICGKDHTNKKKEEITETAPGNSKWKRKGMSGLFENIAAKNKIYPKDKFPPTAYKYQGHHCLALSSFTFDSNSENRKDKNATFNFYLDKINFFPNREQNCIGLPEFQSLCDFKNFWKSLDLDKPLQLHGPAHSDEYFNQSEMLLLRLRKIMSHSKFCEKNPDDEWKKKLKEGIAHAENKAFKSIAAANMPWRLHPDKLEFAMQAYCARLNSKHVCIGNDGYEYTIYGGGKKSRPPYPVVNLKTGIF